MSESIQMRTTQEQSGAHRVYAAATVLGTQFAKGLALHSDITSRLSDAEYIEVEFDTEGKVGLEAQKATSATIQFANEPAVRHVYVDPEFLSEFGDFEFNGQETDLDALPSFAISAIRPSSEEAYEADKEEQRENAQSAEEAADALFGDEEESEESEADESEDEEDVEVSDEELGIVE